MTDDFDLLKTALADRYALEREIGAGGMATVYLAEDLKHHRKVAVKVLRPELAAILGTERFHREIEIAANLNHPHILPLLDSGTVEAPPATRPPLRPSAPLFTLSQRERSKSGRKRKPNRRRRNPAGIREQRMSASQRRVPEPHIGSKSGVSPSHPEKRTIAAARVSCIGASTVSCRYPLRWSDPPEVSRLILSVFGAFNRGDYPDTSRFTDNGAGGERSVGPSAEQPGTSA